MKNEFVVSTGMDLYQAVSLIPWYDVLTDDFIIHLSNYYLKDITLMDDTNLSEYLYDLFKHRFWLKGSEESYLENNNKLLEWKYENKKMIYIRISKIINNNSKITLMELK